MLQNKIENTMHIETDQQPKLIIINLSRIVNELKLSIGSEWLPVLDIHSLLSIIFTCFITPINTENLIPRTLKFIVDETIENRDLSDIQKIYIVSVLKAAMQDIYDELLTLGLLTEYFPYEFKQLLPDGSVSLSKITNSPS